MERRLDTREMTTAFVRRDASYDGLFYVGVRTTGIFCRPSCPARKPHPDNRRFFRTVQEAWRAGFVPCKRCRPLETSGRVPAWLRPLLERLEQAPEARLTDAELRARALPPARVRRYFRQHFGTTFQAYGRALRLGRALLQLQRGVGVDEAGAECGFTSASGFREAFRRTFGRPPGSSRMLDVIVTSRLESPLGPLEVAASPAGICLLEFADRRALGTQWRVLHRRFGAALVPGRNPHIEQLAAELAEYFGGARREFAVPLVLRGTPFQQRVWQRLREIPYGGILSYEALAREIGHAGAQRAVGRANGDNRLAIVIPCHRVVQKDGALRGYGGGLWRKQYLLDLERRVEGERSPDEGWRAAALRLLHA